MARTWTALSWLGALLVGPPAVYGGLALGGALPDAGGHGLGAWLLASCCAASVLLGTGLSALCAWRCPPCRKLAVPTLWIGTAVLFLFVGCSALPFAR